MPRQKITEFRAKSLLLGRTYQGLGFDAQSLPAFGGSFVVKVDQGVKKRFKRGLVALNQDASQIAATVAEWGAQGFDRFLAEPYVPHEASEERYLSLERVRNGLRLLFATDGGVDIEAHPESIKTFLIADEQDLSSVAEATGLPTPFLQRLVNTFNQHYFAFLEINPLVVRGVEVHLLDAAVLVDGAGAFFTSGWSERDVVTSNSKHPCEERVAELGKSTPASLKLTVLNPNGSLFFLLSGGGGSIVIADVAKLQGLGQMIGNYGEYSGGPTREETHLYAREVIGLLLDSSAPTKALIIAGGVANFTDVLSTFTGIIDALSERADELRAGGVKVFVRRGGPNETLGLKTMKDFLEKERLLGSIHGSEAIITAAVDDALRFIRST